MLKLPLAVTLFAAANAVPLQYPPGLTPAECLNYPFCGPAFFEEAEYGAPGSAAAYAAYNGVLHQTIATSLPTPLLPMVPGAAARQAAVNEVLATQRGLDYVPLYSNWYRVVQDNTRVKSAQDQLIATQKRFSADAAAAAAIAAAKVY